MNQTVKFFAYPTQRVSLLLFLFILTYVQVRAGHDVLNPQFQKESAEFLITSQSNQYMQAEGESAINPKKEQKPATLITKSSPTPSLYSPEPSPCKTITTSSRKHTNPPKTQVERTKSPVFGILAVALGVVSWSVLPFLGGAGILVLAITGPVVLVLGAIGSSKKRKGRILGIIGLCLGLYTTAIWLLIMGIFQIFKGLSITIA